MKPNSQVARVLGVLEDGRWHTTAEILAAVPCIGHSRVDELRRRYGHTIEHRATGVGAAGHEYRLVSLREEEVWPVGAREGSPAAATVPGRDKEAASFSLSDDGQLAWDVAA